MSRPARVLVVDDQADIRRVLKAYLESVHGSQVTEAVNGLDALAKLSAAAFDLIITDLIMPEMNGLELVGSLRRNPRLMAIPVIVFTSQGEEKDRQKAAAFGVKDYVLKPFTPQTLRPVIEKYLGG